MLRSLAALVFVAGAVALIAFLALIGAAPGQPAAARHLREMKSRRDPPETLAPMSFAEWRALPHGAPLATYAAIEQRGASLEGWVQRILVASDGDLHMEIAPRPLLPDDRDQAYATAEITPAWRDDSPGWQYGEILAAFRPNAGGDTPWDSGPARVRIGGWLLYDAPYDKPPSARAIEAGAPRLTGWEIHPVTRIEVWNAADSTWKEVRR